MSESFCANCRSRLGDGAAFCASCGSPVTVAAPAVAVQAPSAPPTHPVTGGPPPTAEVTSSAPRAHVWAVLVDSKSWKRWSGEECKGDLTRVGAKVKRSSAASGGIMIGGGGEDRDLPKDRTYEVVEVTPEVRLVLRAKTWVSETVERWELKDVGGGTSIAVWITVSGPLAKVAGVFNRLGYGSKLKALASEAARVR